MNRLLLSRNVLVLYPTRLGKFYIVDPVSKQSKWFTQSMYLRLRSHCTFRIYQPRVHAAKQKKLYNNKRRTIQYVQYYIDFNTADRNMHTYPSPSKFAVPLYQSNAFSTSAGDRQIFRNTLNVLPPKSKIVSVRIHKAVIPKSQQVVHALNRTVVFCRSDTLETLTVNLTMGNFTATDVGREVQSQVRALGLDDFTVTLDVTTGRVTMSTAASSFDIIGSGTTADRLLGLVFDSKDTSMLSSVLDTGGSGLHQLVTQHADVSGSQMLTVTVSEIKDRPVAHVPLFDLGSSGLVYYHNSDTGGDPVPMLHPPRSFGKLTCSCRDESGELYDFNGVNATYVFEIICAEIVEK